MSNMGIMKSRMGMLALSMMALATSGMNYGLEHSIYIKGRRKQKSNYKPTIIIDKNNVPKGHKVYSYLGEFRRGDKNLSINFEYSGGTEKSLLKARNKKHLEIQEWLNSLSDSEIQDLGLIENN